MQQTKSYWRLVAVAGVVSAFIGSACTVTTSTDDDDFGTAGTSSGTAGSGTAGSSTAGTAGAAAGSAGAAGAAAGSAGTAGTAGTGGAAAVPFQCDADDGKIGTPNTCAPTDSSNDCQKCIQAKCCTEQSACYATGPGNQCGWGGPLTINDKPNPGGEAYCIETCIQDGVVLSGTAPDEQLVGTCANNCSTSLSNGSSKDCGAVIGTQTNDLINCLMDNCSADCFGGE